MKIRMKYCACRHTNQNRDAACRASVGSGIADRGGDEVRLVSTEVVFSGVALETEFLDFFIVVLAVEDTPFFGTLNDGAALALDLHPRGLIDARFLHQQLFEDLANLQADGIAVFDELHVIHVGHRIGDHVGQLVDFIAAQSHGSGILREQLCTSWSARSSLYGTFPGSSHPTSAFRQNMLRE